jgi:hypothetical protein
MVKNQEIDSTLVTGNIEPSKEAFAYCQTCKKILETSGSPDEVKQTAQEHKLISGFEDHKAGYSLESYILTD